MNLQRNIKMCIPMREIFWGKVYKFYGVLAMTECLVFQPAALGSYL